jgi:hypothetical protein
MQTNMCKMAAAVVALAALSACGGGRDSTGPTQVKANALAFVACPQYRDLKIDVPLASACWVVEHQGKKYGLGNALGTPQLGHRMLVEAVDTGSAEQYCGGQVLSNVRVSVLPEIDNTCQTVLDPEGVTLPPPPPFAPPALSTEPATPLASSTYAVLFAHQSDFIGTGLGSIPFFAEVEKAAKLAIRGNARSVVVTGHAISTLLVDGPPATESLATAQARAERVALALRMLGVPAGKISVQASPAVPVADGAAAWLGRSVLIDVTL